MEVLSQPGPGPAFGMQQQQQQQQQQGTTAEQLVTAFRQHTGLTEEAAVQCLRSNGFDLQQAVQDLQTLEAQGSTTPDQYQEFYTTTVPTFMQASGLRFDSAKECLVTNGCDFHRAGAHFTLLKQTGQLAAKHFVNPPQPQQQQQQQQQQQASGWGQPQQQQPHQQQPQHQQTQQRHPQHGWGQSAAAPSGWGQSPQQQQQGWGASPGWGSAVPQQAQSAFPRNTLSTPTFGGSAPTPKGTVACASGQVQRACASCQHTYAKSKFSVNQWKKSEGVSRCRNCTSGNMPQNTPHHTQQQQPQTGWQSASTSAGWSSGWQTSTASPQQQQQQPPQQPTQQTLWQTPAGSPQHSARRTLFVASTPQAPSHGNTWQQAQQTPSSARPSTPTPGGLAGLRALLCRGASPQQVQQYRQALLYTNATAPATPACGITDADDSGADDDAIGDGMEGSIAPYRPLKVVGRAARRAQARQQARCGGMYAQQQVRYQ